MGRLELEESTYGRSQQLKNGRTIVTMVMVEVSKKPPAEVMRGGACGRGTEDFTAVYIIIVAIGSSIAMGHGFPCFFLKLPTHKVRNLELQNGCTGTGSHSCKEDELHFRVGGSGDKVGDTKSCFWGLFCHRI